MLGLLGFIEAKEGSVDDFVFVDQGGAGETFALVSVVGTVAHRRELPFFGSGDFCHECVCAGAMACGAAGA